jgi:hypothetical protein
MRPLTKEAEAKLIAAIEKAAGYVNDGLAPNDAIVKSAAAANVPAGHINLMVHAYNTGRTTKQREQGDSTLDKAADFPLADAQTVLDRLYPSNVKTSAEIARSSVISPEYAVPPRDLIARRNAGQVKAAAAKLSLPEKTWTPPPRDEEAAARKAASDRRAAELAAEELRRQATAAYAKAAAAMDELHEYFRHPGNVSFQDALRETEMRLGDEGVSVLKKLAAVYPHLEKQAARNELIYGECEPVKLAGKVLDAVYAYNEAKAAVPVKEAFVKKAAPEILTKSILYNAADEPLTLKAAAGFGGAVSGIASGIAKAPSTFGQAALGPATAVGGAAGNMDAVMGSPDEAKNQAFQDLSDPAHENELKSIRAQGVLHDLMLNDPVISGEDPHEVALAFNDIAEIAPSFVDAPGAMQALLRKRLQAGQLADFDVKQLIDMEKAKADSDKSRAQTLLTQQDLI